MKTTRWWPFRRGGAVPQPRPGTVEVWIRFPGGPLVRLQMDPFKMEIDNRVAMMGPEGLAGLKHRRRVTITGDITDGLS